MSGIVSEIGIGLVERFGGDIGKMLAAALGGGVGAAGYKYFQPASLTRGGFDRSKGAARKTGTNVGRAISIHYGEGRINAIPQSQIVAPNFQAPNRQYKKHGSTRRNSCNTHCNCSCSGKRC